MVSAAPQTQPPAHAEPHGTLAHLETNYPPPQSTRREYTNSLDQLAIGSVLGNYEIVGRLGKGSTSVVFQGQHRKLRIPVAVKVLDMRGREDDSELRRRLVSEAILLARINHPNIVRIWDLNEEGPLPYLVLEFVDGGTLADLIGKNQPLPVQLAFAIVRQAAEGLAEAQKIGVVHRDVKPGNLLVAPDGHIKVADLGLAVALGSLPATKNECSGALQGTAAYMAPEQASEPQSADFRADIYALGATLYHAVTGRLPFKSSSPLESIYKHLTEIPESPRRFVPELSEECAELILKMLAKRPEDRFNSYDDLRAALARSVGDRRAPRPLAETFLTFAFAAFNKQCSR